ncbi:thioredoxin TrxC [Oleiagrimonas soli]|uniref:Thioredoxin n=1 Tax=Oleiagrimonas soli TaxID=1543381 RepID=A0A099CVX6_9GAMM|nr:thioredoxin TrxC [Oleiagrimonas soli]KGI78083.1 thioredoxin [Oleiagrimonas soli]MBB6183499.1 thioredoxin 2 [Oleiagrimonas soli]
MNASMHIVCPHCEAINRVPAERLGAAPSCGKCHQPLFQGVPLDVDAARFEKHLTRSDLPLLVDFWAPWCGPCRMMAPEFVRAAGQLEPRMRLLKVDTEAVPALGARYGIRSIPTLMLFRNGCEVARQAGAMNASGIAQWAQGHGV